MQFDLDDKSEDAKKARIALTCVVEMARNQLQYDFVISKIIWGLTVYFCTGRFGRERISAWPLWSEEALEIRKAFPQEWRKRVIFEHRQPISVMYELLRQKGTELTTSNAKTIISQYEPVVISSREDDQIRRLGFLRSGDPPERYKEIKIVDFRN